MISATISATAEETGMRLDQCLVKRFPATSRALVKAAVDRGSIRLCGSAAAKGAKLKEGDIIEILELLDETDNHTRPNPNIKPEIVLDDGYIIAANKPSGMAVHPLSPYDTETLASGIVALRPELSVIGNDPLCSGAVHRIDSGTSGLVLFAASNFMFAAMRALFAARRVKKTYLALVDGKVDREGVISCELAHEPRCGVCRMTKYASLSASERAKERPLFAETRYRPLRRDGSRTLLEVEIATGVTHQIRAQLAMTGHPIAGDTLYGGSDAGGRAPANGFCLHSLSAEFIHPATGKPITTTAPRPVWSDVGQ